MVLEIDAEPSVRSHPDRSKRDPAHEVVEYPFAWWKQSVERGAGVLHVRALYF
jgi:hypothetical protein